MKPEAMQKSPRRKERSWLQELEMRMKAPFGLISKSPETRSLDRVRRVFLEPVGEDAPYPKKRQRPELSRTVHFSSRRR